MREDAFRAYLAEQNLAPNTLSTRCSTIRRIERAEDLDLDVEFDNDGLAQLMGRYSYSRFDQRSGRPNPTGIDIEPERLSKFIAFYRSALNSYRKFRSGHSESDSDFEPSVESEAEAEIFEAVVEAAGKTFALERDLQAAIRLDISQLEEGLQIVDGGNEARVEAGLIDILAKDKFGIWTIIELKAETGRAPVIAQTLAYMASIAAERGGDVRGIIVAADFDARVELAARAVPNLMLKKYSYRFEFS